MTLDLKMFTVHAIAADGAWGTQLELRGLSPGAPAELLNVENPGPVEAVANAYVEAGAEVILTNTFASHRFALQAHGAGDRAAEIAEAGAAISRRASGTLAKVFGSIGPSGRLLSAGEVTEEGLSMAYAEVATGLSHGGADAIVLETFSQLDELEIALRAVREATPLPVVVSMTFASGPDFTLTRSGNTPGDLARVAIEGGAAAIGANCGAGPDQFVRLVELLRAASALPVWVKPNAGLPVVTSEGVTFSMGPDAFAAHVPALAAAGARIIGGCCGTNAEHVRAIRLAIERLRR